MWPVVIRVTNIRFLEKDHKNECEVASLKNGEDNSESASTIDWLNPFKPKLTACESVTSR